MKRAGYDHVRAAVERGRQRRPLGRVSGVGQGLLELDGLSAAAAIGDLVRIGPPASEVRAEVVALQSGQVTVLPDRTPAGLSLGTVAALLGPVEICPDDSWIGRVIDPYGQPLDGRPLLPGLSGRPLHAAPPPPTARRGLGARLETGFSVLNTMLPLVRGQRIGLFAGSGVGKSTLMAGLAQQVEADVVVIALIGERGRELRDFVETVLGPEGMRRAVVVAATSDRSAALRRRCAPAAMAVAEHFRDQGRQVLLLTDSITRLAGAHREIAAAAGDEAGPDGYPASTTALITSLCERAGPGVDGSGDITAIFTVLVAGSNMEEPVADILRGVLDGHVVLDRQIAERGRFPAIDLLRSVSRALPGAASDAENKVIGEVRRLLGAYEKAEMMVQAGLYARGSDPTTDAAIEAWPRIDAFIARREPADTRSSFKALARCLPGGAARAAQG